MILQSVSKQTKLEVVIFEGSVLWFHWKYCWIDSPVMLSMVERRDWVPCSTSSDSSGREREGGRVGGEGKSKEMGEVSKADVKNSVGSGSGRSGMDEGCVPHLPTALPGMGWSLGAGS